MVNMKLIQPISSWLIQQLKKIWFWLSVVLGAAISFVIYQEVLVKLWTFESLRVSLYSIFLFVLFSTLCFFILNYFLIPQLKHLTKIKRASMLGLSSLSSLILVIILLNQPNFSKETVYLLLPSHTIQIESPATTIKGNEDIVLSLFSNQAQGELSFNSLNIKGWERRDNQLFLINPAENQITWRGKVGYEASLIFLSRSSPATINVSWDGINTEHSLYSASPHDISITNQFEVPFYAG